MIGAVDQALKSIRAVEESWSLPKLPDMVSLDLAAFSGLDTLGLQQLLTGLDDDVQSALEPPLHEPTTRSYTFGQNARRIISGVANFPLPSDVDTDAVQQFKARAIRHGYLDPQNVTMDSSWSPALNNVYWDMRNDDFTRAKQGSVPGPGSSIGEVMETMDKWLSPTGLLEAATELGMFWDINQIREDWAGGQPLKDFGEAWLSLAKLNPLDAMKSWWKAASTMDDLLMPAINIALLSSGVGQVALFGRAVKGGLVGAKALRAVNGVKYSPLTKLNPRLGRLAMETTDVGADVNRMRQGGLIAGRLAPGAEKLAQIESTGKTVNATRVALGQKMTAWREMPNVMITKKAVQKGMQLGFVSRTEQALGINPDTSLSDLPGVRSGTQFMRGYGEPTKASLPASIMFEAMFTPTLIIQSGVVKNPFGYLSRFSKVAEDAFYTEEFSNAVTANLLTKADEAAEAGKGPAEIEALRAGLADAWRAEVRAKGATKALADRFTGGDTEKLGGWMTWMAISAAVDAAAHNKLKAGVLAKTEDIFDETPSKYILDFHTARNGYLTQIRHIDPNDPERALRMLANAKGGNARQADILYMEYLDEFVHGPKAVTTSSGRSSLDQLDEMIEAHNTSRVNLIKTLLEEHMKPGMLELAVQSKLDDMGDWQNFVKISDEIEEAFIGGKLHNSKTKVAINPETGRQLGRQQRLVDAEGVTLADDILSTELMVDIRDVLDDPAFLEYVKDGTFNMFGGTIDARGKFTVARIETISKQDKVAEAKAITTLQKLKETYLKISGNPVAAEKWRRLLTTLQQEFGVSTANFGDIKKAELDEVMRRLEITEDNMGRIRRVRTYAMKHEIAIDDIVPHIDKRLTDMERSDRWARVHGINSDLSLDKKVKALERQIKYTAAEVDLDSLPEAVANKLRASGYKLVHGVEYMTPNDLKHALVEVKDIVEKGKYDDSLGFIGRKHGHRLEQAEARSKRALQKIGRAGERYEQDQVTKMYSAQIRNSLHKTLYAIKTEGRNWASADSVDIQQLIDRLDEIVEMISTNNTNRLRMAQTSSTRPGRMVDNVKSSFSPATPADLVRNNKMTQLMIDGVQGSDNNFVQGLSKYYSDEEIVAIIDGLKGARVVGPQLRGTLVNMQDKLQANPNLTNAMRLMAKTNIMDPTAGKVRSVYQGGLQWGSKAITQGTPSAGLYFAAALQDDDDGFRLPAWKSIGIGLTGRALAGTKIGMKAQVGMLKAGGIGKSAKIMPHGVRGPFGISMSNAATKWDNNLKWKHYSYMADHLSMVRDFMRFSLSPVFDASRYTEGMVLSQIAEVPESVQRAGGLRFNISPTRWKKDRARQIAGSKKPDKEAMRAAEAEWDDVLAEFSGIGASRHDFDFEALEASTARFRQIGVLGFNTQSWMASMYADLTRIHKMPKWEAYETAKKAYTYGLNPRTGAEMNMNAIFFPFSFTKKTFGHAARYLGHDWSRAAMLHDAIKTYEVLDEHYNLADLFRERMPILDKMKRLNPFAYGLTPGEFGGANRPYINFFNASGIDEVTINPIMNLFLPQGAQIRNSTEIANYEKSLRRLAPVYNDIDHLIEDLSEQGHVFFGGTGLTRAAEAEHGYNDVAELNNLLDGVIKARGGSGIDDIRKKNFKKELAMQQAGKQAVRDKYPAYATAVAESVGNSILRTQEQKELVAAYDAAGWNHPPDDASREEILGYLISKGEDLVRTYGSYDEIPPSKRDAFRGVASRRAENEHYLRLGWRKHLSRTWGPIESVLG